MEPDQLWQTTIVLPDADQIRTNARNYGLQVLKTIVSGVQKQRDTFPRRCVHIGHALDIGQKADWRGLQWQVATSGDGNTGNWIVEEFSPTIQLPVLVCPITKGQGIRMVDHVMAVSSKGWFWGWLETAKQKRHILDGMEGPFLFCCVTWKQQLLCFCPGQLLCGVPCGLHHCEIISLVWNHSPVSHKPITFRKSDRFVAYRQQINLCSQIFRLWIDHWLCNLTDNDNFLRFKNFSLSESLCCTIWPAIWAKLSKWSWDSDSEKGISVFKTNILSHNTRLFFGKHRILS